MTPATIVVVGAGLAGSRAAETLRAEGYDGRLILIGDEATAPYERPALSKEYLAGEKSDSELLLRAPSFWTNAGIELRLGRRVASLDPRLRTATLSTGEEIAWDALVLATGARPRRPPFARVCGVHTLRTLADARALRAAMAPGARIAIVGGGFIGAEVASTALAAAMHVTLIEALHAPFERTLGVTVGRLLSERYRAWGADLRLATGVVGFATTAEGRLTAARLSDGTELPCDVALVGVGIEPARELLPQPLEGVPIYACGDVTGGDGHWSSAAAEATAVARRLLRLPVEPPGDPFFWSDQFGLRLQLVGRPAGAHAVSIDGTPDCFVARYTDEDGRLVAGLTANRPPALATLRRELAA